MLRSATVFAISLLFASSLLIVAGGCGSSGSSEKNDTAVGVDVPVFVPDTSQPDTFIPQPDLNQPTQDTVFTFPDFGNPVPEDTSVATDVVWTQPDTAVVVPDTAVANDVTPSDSVSTTCQEDDKGLTVDNVKTDGTELTLSTDWATDYKNLQLCTDNGQGAYFDWFKFKVEKKGSFVFSVEYTVTGACVDVDIYTDVPPTQSTYLVGKLDETGSGTNSVETTLEPGVYYIRVSSWDGSGPGGCAAAENGKSTGPYSLLVKQAAACTADDACTTDPNATHCVTTDTTNKGLCVECTEDSQCSTKNTGTSLLTACGDGTDALGGPSKENTCVCEGNDLIGVSESDDPTITTIDPSSAPVEHDGLQMCSTGDIDWFALKVDSDTDVTITVNEGDKVEDLAKEFDIYLFEKVEDGPVSNSYGSATLAVNTLVVPLKAGTTYYIAINAYAGFGYYKLSVKTGGAPTCDPACENGGTCVEGRVGNTCQCTAGFTGDHCQTPVVAGCDPACVNGACYDDNGVKKCDCIGTSFKGLSCELAADCGADGPGKCVNGNCINKGNDTFICECDAGFGGKRCDKDSPPSVWINELHYDNALKWDVFEGVELAGPTGKDLSGWKLAFYGPGGKQYASGTLVAGTVIATTGDSVQGKFGTIWIAMPFPANPNEDWQTVGNSFLHNAGTPSDSPDKRGAGIALIDPTGAVVQFICYETVGFTGFTATDGLAQGERCEDIEVSQNPANSPYLFDHDEDPSTTSVIKSLQLQGKGSNPWQFTWSVQPLIFTPGAPNTGQTFE